MVYYKRYDMPKILHLKPLTHYKLSLKFDDGTKGSVDLSHLIGKGVFAVLKDQKKFKKVSIGKHGEVCWEGGLDLCPDSLYLIFTNKKPEDIFPSLKEDQLSA